MKIPETILVVKPESRVGDLMIKFDAYQVDVAFVAGPADSRAEVITEAGLVRALARIGRDFVADGGSEAVLRERLARLLDTPVSELLNNDEALEPAGIATR